MATPIVSLIASPVVDSTGAVVAGGTLEFVDTSDSNTRVNVWRDRDATLAWTQPITLDGGGRAGGNVYIKDPCRLLIADAEGTLIWDTDMPGGVTDRNVEVVSDAFTGSVGTATTAGERTFLKTVLDRAETSFGGTDWQHLDSASGTERPYVDVVREFGISVKSYGAVGDGSANDTAAFSRAIAKVKANGGGTVIVPPGTYNLATAQVIDANGITIQGIGSPIIQMTASNVNAFTLTSTSRCKISGIRIRIAVSVGGDSTAYGISATSCDYLAISDVSIENSVTGSYNFLRAVNLDTCTYASISDSTLFAGANATFAVLAASGQYNKITGCSISADGGGGSGGGVHFNGETDSLLANSSVAASGGSAITNTASRIQLSGNNIYSAGGTAYTATGAARVVTAGNIWFTTSISVAAHATGTNSNYTDTPMSGADLTSTATVNPANPGVHKTYSVTAHSANVDTFTGTGFPTGFVVNIQFQANTQWNDGTGNMKLAGNFSGTADDVLTLMWNGTNWLEVSRANN